MTQYEAAQRKQAASATERNEMASAVRGLEIAEEKIREAAIHEFEKADRTEKTKAGSLKMQIEDAEKKAKQKYTKQNEQINTEKAESFTLTQANYIGNMQQAAQAKVIEVHQLDPNYD